MRVMVLVNAVTDVEAGVLRDEKLLTEAGDVEERPGAHTAGKGQP